MRTRTLFPNDIRIVATGSALAVHTPYDPAFVAQLKARLSPAERKWDSAGKVWIVAANCGPRVRALIETHFGTLVDLPATTGGPQPFTTILDVRYIGATKPREDGSESAFGWCEGGWNAIFPRSILMAWFGQEQRPGESPTLYGVLGVSQTANHDALRAAWKRMVKQWHPDHCREPDATGQFRAIQEAWEILGDRNRRARYDAGMALETAWKAQEGRRHQLGYQDTSYRSPLRCGLILAVGSKVLGRYQVDQILQWTDIVDDRGRTLVTSWPAGAKEFTESWV